MSSNKLFLTYLIIFALILALIISIVISNGNKRMTDDINNINAKEIDNKSNNEIIGSNNNIINKIEYTKVNLLNTNNIEVNQFQFSEIGVLQINQNPMLHFIISNNKNEKTENCNFRLDIYNNEKKLIDTQYVSLSEFSPNEKKRICVKLDTDEKNVKSVRITKYKNSDIYIIK